MFAPAALRGHDLDGRRSQPLEVDRVVGNDPTATGTLGTADVQGVVDHATPQSKRCDAGEGCLIIGDRKRYGIKMREKILFDQPGCLRGLNAAGR